MTKINQILSGREEKYLFIKNFFMLNKEKWLISLNINIAGENKLKEDYLWFYGKIKEDIFRKLNQKKEILITKEIVNTSGPTIFWGIRKEINPLTIKEELVEVENYFKRFSKFIDLDLYVSEEKLISRQSLKRTCFICEKEAIYCTRNKNHSYNEVIQLIDKEMALFRESNKEVNNG